MSTLARQSALISPRRQYISLNAFHNDIFSYSTSTSIVNSQVVTTGTLTALSAANATNSPAERVLIENGKKLFPSANPGVSTYMVGVYDPVTFYNGFINPNSPIFTPMNTDKPYHLSQGSDPNGGLNLAPPVLTAGDVSAGGDLYVSGSADISGNTTLGGDGDPIVFVKTGNFSVNPPSLAALANGNVTVTHGLTFAATDTLIVQPPIALESGLIYNGMACDAATLTINVLNTSGSTIDGATRNWRYVWTRFA